MLVYRIDGPFFFGAAEKLESTLERAQLDVETVVIRLGRVPFMDATGMNTLSEIIQRFQRRRVRVMLCGIHDELRGALDAAGILRAGGRSEHLREHANGGRTRHKSAIRIVVGFVRLARDVASGPNLRRNVSPEHRSLRIR